MMLNSLKSPWINPHEASFTMKFMHSSYTLAGSVNSRSWCLWEIKNQFSQYTYQVYRTRSVNLLWKRGSWFQVWKLGVSLVLNVQQTEACSTGLRVSTPKFLFNYTQICLFLKSPLWKVISFHIPVQYRIQFVWRLHDPHPKNLRGHDPLTSRIDVYVSDCNNDNNFFRLI